MIKLYTDAATKGNPGPTGLGILILVNRQQIQRHLPYQVATNHEGEFAAAIQGFTYLKEHYPASEAVLFYTDSRILSDAIGKNYAKHFQPQLAELMALMDYFSLVVTQWVPEKENQGAHQLANQALHSLMNK